MEEVMWSHLFICLCFKSNITQKAQNGLEWNFRAMLLIYQRTAPVCCCFRFWRDFDLWSPKDLGLTILHNPVLLIWSQHQVNVQHCCSSYQNEYVYKINIQTYQLLIPTPTHIQSIRLLYTEPTLSELGWGKAFCLHRSGESTLCPNAYFLLSHHPTAQCVHDSASVLQRREQQQHGAQSRKQSLATSFDKLTQWQKEQSNINVRLY